MSTANRFNLLDEQWLPIEDRGRMSLHDVFSDVRTPGVAGSPIQKIAAMKFLLAIVQSAVPLATEEDWKQLTNLSLARAAGDYLESHRDDFWLYGEKPFLQMPAIAEAKVLPYGALNPEIACGNTTVLTASQVPSSFTDAEKACLLLRLQGFATGGKKVDNSIVLSPGYVKKKGGAAGPSLGFMGYLHTFVLGPTLMDTLRINLLTSDDIRELRVFPEGLGKAPWEEMPEGEDCPVARRLKQSLMGRLMPMNRFCLIAEGEEEGMHYTEGIRHSDYKEGMADPSAAVSWQGKAPKALWVNPEKRPWRSLTSLLRFLSSTKGDEYSCPQLQIGLRRAAEFDMVRIWSGGLRVSSNAGEQYATGLDDYVESVIDMDPQSVSDAWLQRFAAEMNVYEQISKILFGSVRGYYTDLKVKDSPKAEQAVNAYWQQAEAYCNTLVERCEEPAPEGRMAIRKQVARIARSDFTAVCSHETPRQLTAWVNHVPNLSKFLN
jgi:CRISPR system Cascade subunit CasA